MKNKLTLKNGFSIQANANKSKTHDIFMYGIIGWDIDVKKLWNEINNLPKGTNQLDFYVHSDGGFVTEGYALLSNLDRLKEKYHTRGFIDGIAASMASAFVVNMHETIPSPTSKLMIHDPWLWLDIYGGYNSKEIEILMESLGNIREDLDADSEIMAGVYARKTGLSEQEVRDRWLSDGKDHSFTPQQMLDEGLADRIAEHEFKKAPDTQDEDEDEWLANFMEFGRKAAASEKPGNFMYRGAKEKVFSRFALNLKNPYDSDGTQESDTDGGKSKSKPSKQMSKFAKLAKKFGFSEDAEPELVAEKAIARMQTLESETEQKQGLIDQYKETQQTNESRISQLEESLRESKVGSVVNSVIEEVEKNQDGKTVNKKVREKMDSLAADHLKAKDEGNDTQADNSLEHMKLVAKSNLIPLGKDKNLEDGPEGRDDTETTASYDPEKYKKARAKGEAKRKKMQKRHQD